MPMAFYYCPPTPAPIPSWLHAEENKLRQERKMPTVQTSVERNNDTEICSWTLQPVSASLVLRFPVALGKTPLGKPQMRLSWMKGHEILLISCKKAGSWVESGKGERKIIERGDRVVAWMLAVPTQWGWGWGCMSPAHATFHRHAPWSKCGSRAGRT